MDRGRSLHRVHPPGARRGADRASSWPGWSAGAAPTRATRRARTRLAAAADPSIRGSLPRVEGFSLVILLLLIAAATLVSEDLTCITTGLMIARGTHRLLARDAGLLRRDLRRRHAGLPGGPDPRPRGAATGRRSAGSSPRRPSPGARSGSSARARRWCSSPGCCPGTRLPDLLRGRDAPHQLRDVRALLLHRLRASGRRSWSGLSAAFGEATQRVLGVVRERAGAVSAGHARWCCSCCSSCCIPLVDLAGPAPAALPLAPADPLGVLAPLGLLPPGGALRPLAGAQAPRASCCFTAVNPAIPGGGFVGESKSGILAGPRAAARTSWRRIRADPRRHSPPAERIAAGPGVPGSARRLDWPLVLKPDIGERGSGVAIIRSEAEVAAYLERAAGDTIVQAYAPGAEFGVFYVRRPGEAGGQHLLDHRQAVPHASPVTARRTLEELILRRRPRGVHGAVPPPAARGPSRPGCPPRARRCPWWSWAPTAGARCSYDGEWVRTPELEAAIDRLSRGFDGILVWPLRHPHARTSRTSRRGRNFKVRGAERRHRGGDQHLRSGEPPGLSLPDAVHPVAAAVRDRGGECGPGGAAGERAARCWALVRRHRRRDSESRLGPSAVSRRV